MKETRSNSDALSARDGKIALIRVINSLKKALSRAALSSESANVNPEFYKTILPESVRYALEYKKSPQIDIPEIIALIPNWIHESVYLTTKLLEINPKQQQEFIEKLCHASVRGDEGDLSVVVREALENARDNQIRKIPGDKLTRISRAGAAMWQEKFTELAAKTLRLDSGVIPHLVCYTGMLGFYQFARQYSQHSSHRQLCLLMPEWMKDEANPALGYTVDLVSSKVEMYSKAELEANISLIDDTINTGNGINFIQNYWQTKMGKMISDELVFSVSDLREKT